MLTQSTPGERFKQVREQLGRKQFELAQRLSTDAKKISRIEKDVQLPDSRLLIQLGEQYGVRSDWLLQGRGSMFEQEISHANTHQTNHLGSYAEIDPEDFAYLPVYDVKASAGPGAFNDFCSQEAVQHMAFLNSWIHGSLGTTSERLVVIRAVGDSMIPTIGNGDSLLIDISPHFAGDGLYCVQLHDTLFAKRVQRQMDHSYQLISDNPNYDPLNVTHEDEGAFRLIGRILWVGRQV